MSYNYKILAFDPKQGTITIQFEGYEAYAFTAPFINGNYLTGQALEDYIQTLYPQVMPYESRLALVETISGAEALTQLVQPPVPYIQRIITTTALEQPALVVSVESLKSTCFIGDRPEALITFDKPVTMNTFVNIALNIPSSPILYMPSQYESIPGASISPYMFTGVNGETLEMYIGSTTAKYIGPVYPGGVSYTQATISAKTQLNQQDNQPYITSALIQLISEPVSNT